MFIVERDSNAKILIRESSGGDADVVDEPREEVIESSRTIRTFPQVLKKFRERAGVSQSKLSEEADLDHSYISRLESGGRFPAPDAVERIAKALSLSADDTDRLFWSAGFVGNDPIQAILADSEPILADVLTFLQDDSESEEVKENMREHLKTMLRLIGRTAITHAYETTE